MAKVLFTHSYFYRLDGKQWKAAQPYPPLGTITAASLARSQGHEVSLFDAGLAPGSIELEHFLGSEPDYLVIYDDGFNYLTKMCLTTMRDEAFSMIGMAKAKDIKVLVCSSDSTDHADDYLQQGADAVILGEGEQALTELLQGNDFTEIRGISFLQEGKLFKTQPRPVLKDLDSLPMAAWDLIDIDAYRKIWVKNHGYFSLNLATTRGCPYKCNWCAKPIYGNRYNSRSPKKVAEEIAYLDEHFQPDHYWMCDDIFGLKPGWVKTFRQELQKRNLTIRFKIQSRADLLLKEDSIRDLAEAGLQEVWVGAESGSQKILDAMDKGTTVKQIYQASTQLKKYDVKLCFFLQFGYLGETREDISSTLNLVKEIVPDNIGISVSYPLPGTKFYEKVKAEMAGKRNWTDSDDLDTMYQSPFPSTYYKTLHRFVHKMFRRERARLQMRNLLKASRTVKFRELLSALYYEPAYWLYYSRLKRHDKKLLRHEF